MNTHQSFDYDYIVTGGGCAGLSFIMHVLNEPALQDKRILLLEKESKLANDRTWCFWEKSTGFFENIIYKKWDYAWFHDATYSSLKSLAPYSYKMIRGIDFYTHCYTAIRASDRVDVQHGEVLSLDNVGSGVQAKTSAGIFSSRFAFNSILFQPPQLKKDHYLLLQHFKGWVIETDEPVFDPEKATLMDFRVDQSLGTTFFYVMPFSPTRALVEYTLFTHTVLESQQYDEGLRAYVGQFLGTKNYRVVEEEFGVIPMTDHLFPVQQGNIIYLGTAGGQTKPSSGYTFRFIQKHALALVESLKKNDHPFLATSFFQKRFMWYDRVLLHMLYHKKMPGSRIFSLLFRKNQIKRIFRFLDNETGPIEELFLLNTLPQFPFMKAGLHELRK